MKLILKNKNLIRSKAYIDGNWVAGLKRKSFSVINPFNHEKIASIPDLGRLETIQAIEAAEWAFSPWSETLPSERAKKLKHLSRLVEENQDDLASLLSLEQGKPFQEAKGEVLGAASTIQWIAEEAARIYGLTQSSPDSGRSVLTIKQPLGVVGIITPWNFPLSIPAQKAFSAVAAGCTVVLKPAEETPLSVLALAYLSQEAGIPPGVFNVVTCQDPEVVGTVLASHPSVSKITFTGSTEVGKRLIALSAPTIKKITMELGGNCPAIVFEDANSENALQGIFNLKFYNAGQCCNSVNRIFIHQSLYASFVKAFVKKAQGIRLGSGLEEAEMGPLINEKAKSKIEDLLEDAREKGAQIIYAQKPLKKGVLFPPVIIANAHPDMRLFQEEIFGPVAVFYSFETEDEAVALANETRYGLASYFYTENIGRAMRVAKELEAGTVGVNTTNTYSMTLPFGGWKESGIGREGGVTGFLDEYCEVKAISIGILEE